MPLLLGGVIVSTFISRNAVDLKYHFVQSPEDVPEFAQTQALFLELKDSPILIISRGSKPTGGYLLKIIDAKIVNDDLKISLISSDPQPGSLNIQVITYPYVYLKTGTAKTFSVKLNNRVIIAEKSL
mgnify:CR=1 FL=1